MIHLPYKTRMKVDSAAFHNDKWKTPRTIAGQVLLAVPSTSHLECDGSRRNPHHLIHHGACHLCKPLLLSPHAGAFFPIPFPSFLLQSPTWSPNKTFQGPGTKVMMGSHLLHHLPYRIPNQTSLIYRRQELPLRWNENSPFLELCFYKIANQLGSVSCFSFSGASALLLP